MSDLYTTTYQCDGCGAQDTREGIQDAPPFWLTVTCQLPSGTVASSHYCGLPCLLDSVADFVAAHPDEEPLQ
jgi:hypothetical protein